MSPSAFMQINFYLQKLETLNKTMTRHFLCDFSAFGLSKLLSHARDVSAVLGLNVKVKQSRSTVCCDCSGVFDTCAEI